MEENRRKAALEGFDRLLTIMDELRAGCPWDRKQTLDSLRPLTIEETYELSDAVLNKDLAELKGELGDLFLHLVFYSKIASEIGAFDAADVLNQVCEKLIRRHPHIYGEKEVDGAQEVSRNWETIKLKETGGKRGTLDGLSENLPPLLKAFRAQQKAAGVGFDWPDRGGPLDKIREELAELEAEIAAAPAEASATADPNPEIEAELGDVFFALVNYARKIGVNPDTALERSNAKFIRRFRFVEQRARDEGRLLTEMNLEEMDAYWDEAKRLEKNAAEPRK